MQVRSDKKTVGRQATLRRGTGDMRRAATSDASKRDEKGNTEVMKKKRLARGYLPGA